MDNSVIIRVGQGTLTFLTPENDGQYTAHPYPVKSSMSIAANLRVAFKEEPYLTNVGKKAVLQVATPTLLVPKEEAYPQSLPALGSAALLCKEGKDDEFCETLYSSVITGHKGEVKCATEIEELDAVVIFPVNSDLQMVVKDHFPITSIGHVMTDVWRECYNKYYKSGGNRKLFAYFHDKMVDIFCFEQHRIRFANSFQATHAHDALYYTLYTWKQLGMNDDNDSLCVMGDMPHGDWLLERYKSYLAKVEVIRS